MSLNGKIFMMREYKNERCHGCNGNMCTFCVSQNRFLFFFLNSLNVQDIQIIKMFLFHLSVTKAQIQIEYK